MDRLQIAIERARAHRAQAGFGEAPQAPFDGTSPGLAEEARREAAAQKAWAGLAPMDLPRGSPAGPLSEQAYAALRTRMLQQMRRNEWRRVAVVSPDPGDGKTTVAARIGAGMTRHRDMRTVVLDLDLRRIGLTREMRAGDLSYGMADVLTGGVPFTRHARRLGRNVAFGLNACPSPDAAELLQGREAAAALVAIDRDLAPGLVIADMPALSVQQDNVAFLEKVDCALIVVAAERTPMTRIDAVERQVAELTEVVGIVLNKCRHGGRGHGYDSD